MRPTPPVRQRRFGLPVPSYRTSQQRTGLGSAAGWGLSLNDRQRRIAQLTGSSTPPGSRGSSGSTTATPPALQAPASTPRSPIDLPIDPAYDQQIAALGQQRDTSLSGLQSQRAATLLGYGYNEGAGGALAFDPNNAFSKAAQLKKRFDESRSATGINMASRGQLYAGSYQNAQDAQNRGQLQAEDSLQKQLLQFLAGNTGQQTQARTNYEMGSGQAQADRLGRLPSNPLYTPGADIAAALPAVQPAPPSPAKPAATRYRGPITGRMFGVGPRPRR